MRRALVRARRHRYVTGLTPGPPRSGLVYRPGRGAVAQMGERCNRTAEVRGSIPLSSTSLKSAEKRLN